MDFFSITSHNYPKFSPLFSGVEGSICDRVVKSKGDALRTRPHFPILDNFIFYIRTLL